MWIDTHFSAILRNIGRLRWRSLMRQQRLFGFPLLLTLALVIVQHASSAQVTDAQPDSAGVGVQQSATSFTKEQPWSASEVITRMDGSRQTIRRMLEQARTQRDIIKTLCLDDKLNQVDVALRSARDHKTMLDSAVQKNDLDGANQQATLLDILHQRTDQLVVEANLCISKETETVGAAAALLSVDPSIVDEPAYYPPGIIIIEPPPTGSVIK
jgi:hypothetical protein